jgi:lysophospholipase L1-like esterase
MRTAAFRHVLAWSILLLPLSSATPLRGEILVKSGQTVGFMGDSITAGGNATPSGYVRLVMSGLAANGVEAKHIGAGISGHKSNQMLERLDKDLLSKKIDCMTLSCGVNDVWHGARGVPLDQYKTNITQIVDNAQAAGVKVVILTSTMIKEDAATPENQKLAEYNAFLRELAAAKGCPLADLNADMQAQVAAMVGQGRKPGTLLTTDGVHMNPLGNMMMARGVLKAMGLSPEQMAVAEKAWRQTPQAVTLNGKALISIPQYEALDQLAQQRQTTIDALLADALSKTVEQLVAQPEKR